MTLAELNEYGIIKAHIEQCREKIREINSRTISSPQFDTSGISKCHNAANVTEEKYIKAISDKEYFERLIEKDNAKIVRIESYIASIPDLRTRMIFEMHIYDGKKFWEIAMKFGGRNTDESVKRIFYRYLNRHPRG